MSDSRQDGARPQLFAPGRLFGTPGALRALEEAAVSPFELIQRHVTGDWGDLDAQDKQMNDAAVSAGLRIFSAYQISPPNLTLSRRVRIWVITEATRDRTTVLLPEEY